HEVRHRLSRLGRFDLPAVLFDRNQLPADAGVKTAAFRVYVVLDADGGDPGPLTVVHGAHDIQRIAVSGIAIGDDRDIHCVGDVALNLKLFAGCDEAGVRNALERGRNGEAACPDAVEAGAFDQAGTQRVVSADNFKRSRFLERSSKPSSGMHSLGMMRKHITVCQWKVLQEELVCGATQIGGPCHRSFDTTRERWIFEKDDAAIGAGFIAQADLRFDALPREDFDRATCELSRRAVELAVARLEECQQLIVRLSTLVADSDAGELAVYGLEFQ